MSAHVAATVDGVAVSVHDVDAREARLRGTKLAAALPRPGTSEGRQLRRWLTQLLVTERVIAAEAAARGLTADAAPTEDELLPDMAARLDIGSVAASALADPLARVLFAHITAAVDVTEADVVGYHARNPLRFVTRSAAAGLAPSDGRRPAAGRGASGDHRTPARRGPPPGVSAVARRPPRRARRACPWLRASR